MSHAGKSIGNEPPKNSKYKKSLKKKALESIRKHNRDTDKDKHAAIADFNAAVQRYIVNGPWQALFVRAENIPQSDFKQQKPGASDEWMWEFNEPTPPSDTPGSGGGDFTPESPEPKTASVAGKKSDHINHVPKATESTLFLTEDAKVAKKNANGCQRYQSRESSAA
ncbi:MAG: hypothetical protein IPL27_01170 [Lewinellaceae bacterium]|nr:hypothetical protein [Lewinellaceae bacterium]